MIIPEKLKKGDEIRIIAPSRSLSLVSEINIKLAKQKLEREGFKITFSKNCKESDLFISSSIKSRVKDIHESFRDEKVKAVLTAIGGFNSNQLLKYLDYDLIKNNPKILCGYSDITALSNAIYAKTGLVTYSGPHFSTWAMEKEFEYNKEYFKKCLMQNEAFRIKPSRTWSDDAWYKNQEDRKIEQNQGYIILNKGCAKGEIVGGNLSTFGLLFGTEYVPDLTNKIVFIEDDAFTDGTDGVNFDRELQHLIHQPNFDKVKALLIGRFQKESKITHEQLEYFFETKKELKEIPVIADVNFGHANPIFTFPIGGSAELRIGKEVSFKIINH